MRSSSACTSSTGECHWSMVAMGEDSTARRFASPPSIGSPTRTGTSASYVCPHNRQTGRECI